MYSAWSTAWISGIAAAVVTAGGLALQFGSSSMPEMPLASFLVVTSLFAALLVGVVMAIATRGGLRLAGCANLSLRFVLVIPAVSLLIVGILATRPIETHAVKLDMPTAQSSSVDIPLYFWLSIAGAIAVPILVSYVVGRLARHAQLNR